MVKVACGLSEFSFALTLIFWCFDVVASDSFALACFIILLVAFMVCFGICVETNSLMKLG